MIKNKDIKILDVDLNQLAIEMLELQARLNKQTNGSGWQSGINKYGKEVNWPRCIYMEIAELIDSTPWKHWKAVDSEIDFINARVEAVDAWHFLMSQLIKMQLNDDITKEQLVEYTASVLKKINTKKCCKVDTEELIESCENIIKNSVILNIEKLLYYFSILFSNLELSPSLIFSLYMGKNALNLVRQNNGYKDGTYVKIWNQIEDNYYMYDIAIKNNYSYKAFVSELQYQYDSLSS